MSDEDPLNPDLVIKNISTLQRFWDKVKDSQAAGRCWEWGAGRMPRGYGLFRINGQNRLAHRVMYRLKKGGIPEGMMVCHTCDNPCCVNPEHHFLGTSSENQQDMKRKGRSTLGEKHWTRFHPDRISFGERNGMAKITPDIVRRIREIYSAGGRSQQSIGDEFGLSQTHVGRIVRGDRWTP